MQHLKKKNHETKYHYHRRKIGNRNRYDVWMMAWEIGELFNVATTAVNAAIRAILKTDVLNDFEVCRYVRLENSLNADVYSLEIIIPIAFRLNTYYTHVFRSWLLRKAYAKE